MSSLENWNSDREKIIGLGNHSSRKSYYPELQKKLAELNRFKELLDHSNESIIMAEAPSGVIIDLNLTAKLFFSLKNNQENKRTIFEILNLHPKHDLRKTIELILANTGDKFAFEMKWISEESGIIPIEVSMTIVEFDSKYFYVIVIRDILERKRAEEALVKSEMNLKAIFNSVYDAIFIHDIDGNILQANERADQMFKITKGTIAQYNINELSAPDYKDKFHVVWEKVLKGEEVVIEWKSRKPETDTLFDTEVGLRKIFWDSKDVILAVVRETTDRKKSEAERLRLQNLESLGLLAGGVAHDFNNILSTIMGATSLSLLNLPEGKLRTNLKRIETATERAAGLTKQLLTFAKGGAPVKSIVDLKKLIEETVGFSLSGSNIVPTYNFEHTESLEADYGQIGQVIQNLVINAKQAMQNGGDLFINTSNVKLNNQQFIKISVRDTGSGIAAENLHKIFDPYFTTKSSGTGLGLSVCHSIVKRHGGILEVDSEIGKGTEFAILLPSISKTVAATEQKAFNHNSVYNIIVIDDEEDIRNILSEALKTLGHTVTSFSNYSNVIKQLENSKLLPDLIIMDFTIKGGKDIKSTVSEIRSRYPEIKIIVSSGYSDSFLEIYQEYGFDGSLNKPYTIDDLSRIIASVFDKSHN